MKVVSLHKNYTKLIQRSLKGDRRSQHQLYELFAPKMLSVCRQYVKNLDQAEEVMLSGFLKVFVNLGSFRSEGSFEGWIRRIMVNESLSFLRKQQRLKFSDPEEMSGNELPVAYLESELEVEEIQRLIDQLPVGYKTVFVLYAVEGYKHSEIAELLQISESTSKSQLFKARKLLQSKVDQVNKLSYGSH